MGQPINVVFTPSSKQGIYRFEVNRCLTGMDHERFRNDDEIIGASEISTDELIRTISDLHLFYTDGVEVPSDDEIVNSDS